MQSFFIQPLKSVGFLQSNLCSPRVIFATPLPMVFMLMCTPSTFSTMALLGRFGVVVIARVDWCPPFVRPLLSSTVTRLFYGSRDQPFRLGVPASLAVFYSLDQARASSTAPTLTTAFLVSALLAILCCFEHSRASRTVLTPTPASWCPPYVRYSAILSCHVKFRPPCLEAPRSGVEVDAVPHDFTVFTVDVGPCCPSVLAAVCCLGQ